jgi:hypothetical protein
MTTRKFNKIQNVNQIIHFIKNNKTFKKIIIKIKNKMKNKTNKKYQ